MDNNGGRARQQPKEHTMKNLNKILTLAAFAAMLSLANSASAQYRAGGDDGITASPKHRQFLNESGKRMVKGTPSATVAAVGYRATGVDGITASPKLRQFINDSRGVQSTPGTVVVKVGYQATGDDGITASPKLRQQLDERRTFMVAPLK